MQHELVVYDTPAELTAAAATHLAQRCREAIAARGEFNLAVSGGHTPWDMFAALRTEDIAWGSVVVYQVDERMAPPDDPDRNLHHLREALGGAEAKVVAMPVEAPDPDEAARWYADELPTGFDLVHLGIGIDGHTASLVPGDPVLEVSDRLVASTTGEYQGRRRMTLTYPALSLARELLWLITGASKADALSRLLSGDTSIPASRVTAASSLVMADREAAGRPST